MSRAEAAFFHLYGPSPNFYIYINMTEPRPKNTEPPKLKSEDWSSVEPKYDDESNQNIVNNLVTLMSEGLRQKDAKHHIQITKVRVLGSRVISRLKTR